jgi:hypothetical protein
MNDLLGNAGRVDQDIRSPELLNNRVDSLNDGATVTDIDLVELNWKPSHMVKLSSGLITEILVCIKDDDCLCSSFSASAGHVIAKTTGTTIFMLAC